MLPPECDELACGLANPAQGRCKLVLDSGGVLAPRLELEGTREWLQLRARLAPYAATLAIRIAFTCSVGADLGRAAEKPRVADR